LRKIINDDKLIAARGYEKNNDNAAEAETMTKTDKTW
jgi:hypothetical protein